jgi:hypothetical protein
VILRLRRERTVTWYAFKLDDTHHGIFDTFETDEARQAHIDGETPKALLRSPMICSPPNLTSLRST